MKRCMKPPEFSTPLLLGTSNLGKLSEIRQFANRLGFSVIGLTDPELKGRAPPPEVPEVAGSYAGNAVLKAVAYARHFGRPCLADDTGLEIPMLGDMPGIHTARWGLARVREEVGVFRKVPARFVCAMAYCDISGRTVVTHGTLEGELRDIVLPSDGMKPLPFGDFFFPTGSSEPIGVLVRKGFEGSHRFQALATLTRVLS
jgi:XTP/dITP diphosphohydrolase